MGRKADKKDRAYQREARTAIKKFGRKYNVSCDSQDEYNSASNEFEDASKLEPPSPTPGGKYAGPSTRDRQTTLREADCQ